MENKCDLLGDESHYNDVINMLKQMSKQLKCINFFRTSALNGYNIKESLNFLINEIIKNTKEEGIIQYNKIKLSKPHPEDKGNKKVKCC